jgi:ABC-2 type transport system ATP-binding protein
MELAIEAKNLTKYYDEIQAVDGINLRIPKGSLYGILGPNGAGKSTTISMLSTVLPPTAGGVKILGYDLSDDSKEIKKHIGVCPQELVLYERLTARENIHLIAQMHGMDKKFYKKRTEELLEKMNLLDRADDLVKTFSGGMKRRINVLMSVIHEPEVIFFDEPTAGLDPQSRRAVWDFIRDFQKQDAAIILTTHNMEEADDLSDYVVIIDHGKIIAEGKPEELKGRVGEGDIIEFKVEEGMNREVVISRIIKLDFVKWIKSVGKRRVVINALDGLRKISNIIDAAKVKMHDVSIRSNTLEDVFIDLTGRRLRD